MQTIQKLAPLFLVITAFSAYALTPSQDATISGNPLHGQDNYTINSQRLQKVTIRCDFTNVGAQPAQLNVWTSPEQATPTKTIQLKPAQDKKPMVVSTVFQLLLKPLWWCQIYLTKEYHNWKFCNYFSISDVVITEYRPFATWDKTVQSKDASYSCTIVKPTSGAQFFYFK